ncbi:hypothetical protein [Alkaliphilus peptidifermentans]|uniref:Uncharacterized protein n=1 Tax=Alkaliphilus peptidifermentans DSM 18978 TaxID=1120976 RepID=A0A1G5GEC5_9FIRM|nr:hypothetical protein [Alkaliphilus peptidifermentans]SCY49923.1 hypothetical protein SAMN03080606_01660 [Alkaliphilus peptidifermentans DSM 18978]
MRLDKGKAHIMLCAFIGVTATWFMNHQMGYGAIVSNGIIGVLAAILLPGPLAGATYAASFVGMSSMAVIPSLMGAAVGGIVVGLILALTAEIYAGIGGKGGTTAALAVLITKTIMGFFG